MNEIGSKDEPNSPDPDSIPIDELIADMEEQARQTMAMMAHCPSPDDVLRTMDNKKKSSTGTNFLLGAVPLQECWYQW